MSPNRILDTINPASKCPLNIPFKINPLNISSSNIGPKITNMIIDIKIGIVFKSLYTSTWLLGYLVALL